MQSPLIFIFKKTYKILIVILVAIAFFLGYNVYLVDRSLDNLKVTLSKINDVKTLDEAKNLAEALDYSLLSAVTSQKLDASTIAKIEMARDILSKPKEISQLEEAKFALQEVIKQKEKDRSPVLVALDKVSKVLAPTPKESSQGSLREEARALEEKIGSLQEKDKLQEAYYNLSNIYAKLSEFSRAKDSLLQAIAMAPQSDLAEKCLFNIAWNEKLQGNLEEAKQRFESIADSGRNKQLVDFSKYQLADIYRKTGEYEKALSIYQDISNTPQSMDMAQISDMQSVYTLLYDLKDSDKAKDVLDKSKEAFKGSSIASHMEAEMIPRVAMQYRIEGFKLLQEAFELGSSPRYITSKGYFDKALSVDPKDGEAYAGLALASYALNEPDKALDYAQKGVELSPDNEIASINLSYLYLEMGLIEKAVKECKRYLSINGASAYGYYNLGYAYVLQNKYQEAAVAFQEATKTDFQFSFAFNNLGWCFWQLGKYGEAVEAFENAVRINPKFIDALFNLGASYEIVGRLDDAKRSFQMALDINPQHYESREQLREIDKFLQQKQAETVSNP